MRRCSKLKCTDCNRPIRPVVALDIDGTLGDYHGHLLNFAEGYLGISGTGWALEYDGSTDLCTFMDLTKHEYRQLKLAFRQGGMKRTMPPFGHASDLAHALAGMGAEVWITTTRPYMRLDNVDPDTRFWLERNHIRYDGLIYDDDKYERLLEIVGPDRIVGVVDDLPDLYDAADRLGLRPIQHATRYNRAVRRPCTEATLADVARRLQDRIQEWRDAHG